MSPKTNRRHLLAAAPLMAASALDAPAEAQGASPVSGALPFGAGEKGINLDVKSQGVTWNGNTWYLVRLGRATFSLGATGHLTGKLVGSTVTFDQVEYDIHVAVFDAKGGLLGTAKALCPVERVWLGKTLLSNVELPLDFGISKGYERARWFTVGITERTVLTPDQWQKR